MFLIGLFRPFFILQGIFTHLLDIFMKSPQHMFQQMAAGGRIHQLMKPVIGNIYLFPVSLLPVKLGHIKNFLHGFHLGIRNMLHGPPGRQTFHQRTDGIDILHILTVNIMHKSPPVRNGIHQTFQRELSDGFPHRCTAHPIAFCQRIFF